MNHYLMPVNSASGGRRGSHWNGQGPVFRSYRGSVRAAARPRGTLIRANGQAEKPCPRLRRGQGHGQDILALKGLPPARRPVRGARCRWMAEHGGAIRENGVLRGTLRDNGPALQPAEHFNP